jgi:hypothetical protein
MNYSVTTKAGKVFTVESNLTDEQAQDVLFNKDSVSEFESNLIHAKRLSPKMRSWLHVLAHWAQNPKRSEGGSRIDLSAIHALLQHARDAGNQWPKIYLKVDNDPVVLAINAKGKVNITDGRRFGENTWYGAIQTDGWFNTNRATPKIVELLEALNADPAKVASQHGVATDYCCFCNIVLKTKESRSVGYGPICAGKFGLPWGEIDPELEKKGQEVVAV